MTLLNLFVGSALEETIDYFKQTAYANRNAGKGKIGGE
jgi:hypothetical protein